ncbi:hypothetical protein I4U23_022645 [Adineta vaga]|nr:hypothetical protein I4U23_022645 [Adineta vaga]
MHQFPGTSHLSKWQQNVPFPIATGDLDGDGKLDVIVGNSANYTIGVFLNAGNGTFPTQVTYPVDPTLTWSIEAIDVNGDGKLDLVTANSFANNVSVYINTGSGTFAPQVTYSTGNMSDPHCATVADVNGDLKPDIIIANFGLNNVGILLNAGNVSVDFEY